MIERLRLARIGQHYRFEILSTSARYIDNAIILNDSILNGTFLENTTKSKKEKIQKNLKYKAILYRSRNTEYFF